MRIKPGHVFNQLIYLFFFPSLTPRLLPSYFAFNFFKNFLNLLTIR